MGLISHIGNILGIFTRSERRKLLVVVLMAVFMALIEVLGVGSIMPFMSVAAKPEVIHSNETLAWVYAFFGFTSDTSFLIFLGAGVLGFLILTNVSQAFMSFTKVKFSSMRRHTISTRMMQGYLSREYSFFLNRNSYEFVKTITTEVQQMITGSVMQLVELIARSIQSLMLILFLFWVNPLSTLIVALCISLIYGTLYFFVRKILSRLGKRRFEMMSRRAKVVSEAFWGIKDVKVTGTEWVFLDKYKYPSREIAKVESYNEIIGDVPKFALESIAFSSIMVFVMVTMLQSGNFADVAGTVTLFAYAGYRLIPAVQGLFKALTKIKYSSVTVKKIIREMSLFSGDSPLRRRNESSAQFRDALELRKITFTYPNTDIPVIKDLSLTIAANSMVGFAGSTGSGKTTLVDIILGLLIPQDGTMIADGIMIDDKTLPNWQQNIGYVPQNIYLSDNPLRENIAFGVPVEDIDQEMVERAAKMAQIHDFIVETLPEGYNTFVGERGVRLSGGQRQRIGIARALYRNPDILVMDEATSALDNQTEKAVMDAIDALQGTKTIILIAHRLTTLQKCDVIFLLDKGIVVNSGNYDTLIRNNEFFGSVNN